MDEEVYLGDSVYAGIGPDGVSLWLDNGEGRKNVIFLDLDTIQSLKHQLQKWEV